MSDALKIGSACIAAALIATPAWAASSSWIVDADGTWQTGVGTPWAGGVVADGADETANINADITDTRTITLGGPRTIGHILFGDAVPSSAANWILSNGGNAANTLTLAGTNPSIDVTGMGTGAFPRIDAVIDGEDGLTKTGSGLLVLNAANTYTGGTTISQGTLRVQNNTALSTGDVTVSSGARLRLQGNISIANNVYISGSNALNSSSGHNAITGTVTLESNATMTTENAANTSLTLGNLVLGSHTLTATNGANDRDFFVTGTITGTGGITKTNVGALTISNDNSATYSGTTTHRRGVLQLGTNGALGSGLLTWIPDNDQSATIRSSDSTARLITNDLTLTAQQLGNGGAQSQFGGGTTGSLTFSGTITVQGNRRLLVASDTTFSGPVSGGGFTKRGAGTLTLTNTNIYTGATIVEAGMLQVNGANNGTGAVTVQTGATLSGTGSIAGAVTFDADSIFLALLDGSLDIGGAVSIADGTLITLAENEILGGSPYTVLKFSPGNLTGAFTVDNSITSQNYEVVYTSNAVVIQPVPEPSMLGMVALAGVLGLRRRR